EEDGARLVTLVGPGGVGKTRLAVAASEPLRERFADGVFFVDLAPVREAERVPRTIAESLDLHEVPSKAVTAAIVDRVGDGKVLLVLDNFEQVLDAAQGLPRLLAE